MHQMPATVFPRPAVMSEQVDRHREFCRRTSPAKKISKLSKSSTQVPQKLVANLWTEFAAQHGEGLATNGKEPQNP